MKNILREYIKFCLLEQTTRVQKGDAAQKRIAAWFALQNFKASVNKPGSSASDVLINGNVSIESKNSESGDITIYSQELMLGSEIAKSLQFTPGVTSSGLSIDRFKPANNGKLLDMKQAEKVRQYQDLMINKALQTDSDIYQVLFGGKSSTGTSRSQPALSQPAFINTLKTDDSIVTKFGAGLRSAIILLTPGKANDTSRLRFWNDGSSKLRAATGGKGKQTLGNVIDPGLDVLTSAWRKDYAGSDDYFAVVSGRQMYIGYINSNPLKLAVKQFSVELYNSKGTGEKISAMSYGGTKVGGMREKVMLRLVGGTIEFLPPDSAVDALIKQDLITVR